MKPAYLGLTTATLFLIASLSPSLLPRHWVFQAIVSGIVTAVAYGLGTLISHLWRTFVSWEPPSEVKAIAWRLLAVGGPGGIYRDSVYPAGHTGAIGLALEAGALARNLPESQHGLASLRPRWNVSGSYLQAVPRLVSLSPDGTLEPFLPQAFGSDAAAADRLFLKGYQWPFQSARALDGGSSLIDLLVWRETIVRGRRVFLDYRDNPDGWDPARLCTEARDYLTRCGATQVTPCERLRQINPGAIVRFADEGIDLATEPVEIAVCFQHNNGGLAANVWWESENLAHLYPIGEVNGSHGLRRPGGSALNSGQVGGQRAAEYLAARGAGWTLDRRAARRAAAREFDKQGQGHLRRGAVPQAERWFRRAAALDPTNILALNGLAEAFLQTERFAQAETMARRALDISEYNPQAHVVLGDVARQAGDLAAAKASYERALQVRSDHWVAKARLRELAKDQ